MRDDVQIAGEVPSRRGTSFADHSLNEEMSTRGYAVLSQRLPPHLVEELAGLYRRVVEEIGRDTSGVFLPAMMISRPDLRAQLWDGVREITRGVLEPLFATGTTEVLGGSFVSKPASPNSVRNPHQDPSIFDETRHVGISVWIPLSASRTSNGTLFVLPASHRMGNHVRPPDVDSLDPDVAAVAVRESVPVELDSGQLLVIDGALIHHSPPNESGVERIAAICALGPAGAPMRYLRSEHGALVGTADIYDAGVELYRSGNLVEPDLRDAPLIERAGYRPASLADLHAARSSR